MAEFALHVVFGAIECLVRLHTQCSRYELSTAELTRLMLTEIIFVVLNLHKVINSAIRASNAFDLRCLVHFDVLLLFEAILEVHILLLAIGAFIALFLPRLNAFHAEHCTLASCAIHWLFRWCCNALANYTEGEREDTKFL